MILAQLKAYGAIAAALVLGGLLLVQTGRLHSEQLAHQKLITATTQELCAEWGRTGHFSEHILEAKK